LREQSEGSFLGIGFFNSPGFWAGLGAPFVFALVVGLWYKKQDEEVVVKTEKEVVDARINVISTGIHQAKNLLEQGNTNGFYEQLEKHIRQVLQLLAEDEEYSSLETLIDALLEKGKEPHTLSQLKEILASCQEARYGFGESSYAPSLLLADAENALEKLSNA
jgi:hypothetical protein